MIEAQDQNGWNDVLIGDGFITVNSPCYFTFEAAPTDIDIHYTTNAQIYSKIGKTLYIKNASTGSSKKPLTYAKVEA